MMPDDYRKIVDEMNATLGLAKPIHALLAERMLVKKARVDKLHPNPDDEFSDPAIGPNFEIVSAYSEDYRRRVQLETLWETEPLMVEKLNIGGYRILNGHHRWYAAMRANVSELPIKILNTVPVEKILSRLETSENERAAAFDLDEVLLCTDAALSDKALSFPNSIKYKELLRRNAGLLITELQSMGFDVWIYTGNFTPESHIRGLLKAHRAKGAKNVGVINFIRHNKRNKRIVSAISNKYKLLVHGDNEGFTVTDPKTKEFESYSLDLSGKDWSSAMISGIRNAIQTA